jgi:mono/diheme cytochrome c family protein
MIAYKKTKILAGIVVLLVAAAAYHQLTKFTVAVPTEAELFIAQKRWPETDPATLFAGYKIFTTQCRRCHGLKNVSKYSEAKLHTILEKMTKRAKLNAEEKEDVRRYLLTEREYIVAQRNAARH